GLVGLLEPIEHADDDARLQVGHDPLRALPRVVGLRDAFLFIFVELLSLLHHTSPLSCPACSEPTIVGAWGRLCLPQIAFLLPRVRGSAAHTGQQESFLEGLHPSKPRRPALGGRHALQTSRPQNSCY